MLHSGPPAGAVAGIIPVGLLDVEHKLLAAVLSGALTHLGGQVLAVEQLHLVPQLFFVVKGVQDVYKRQAYDKMLEAMQEVIDLSVLEGVNLPADNHKAFLESMAPTFKPDGMPSMRQDVLAQRPTEVEEFAGVVRRLAKKHGMPTPANDFFYEKIREIEAGYHKE